MFKHKIGKFTNKLQKCFQVLNFSIFSRTEGKLISRSYTNYILSLNASFSARENLSEAEIISGVTEIRVSRQAALTEIKKASYSILSPRSTIYISSDPGVKLFLPLLQ